jgi:hypothetical protein
MSSPWFRSPSWRPGPSTRPALPLFRLGLALAVVAGCALAGLKTACGEMCGTDLVALALTVAIQGTSALGSFVSMLVACARRDFRRAGVEALVCLGMLLVIPSALWALVSTIPECSAALEGG